MSSVNFNIFTKRIGEALSIVSQNELASNIGVNPSAITQARKKGIIPDRWILQLYRKYGINPDWLEHGKEPTFLKSSGDAESEFRQIPKVKACLSAGGGSFEVASEVKGYYSFRTDWLSKRGAADKMVLLGIVGNSMEPELKDGDTVLIDESQKSIIAGAVYAVGIEDTVMVKRIEKHPNKLVLLSENKNYSPIYLQEDEIDKVRIIGKVIWTCRELI
ncbi:MAG: S24 family peptidase [Candidatus Hodarchaeota archaeon]